MLNNLKLYNYGILYDYWILYNDCYDISIGYCTIIYINLYIVFLYIIENQLGGSSTRMIQSMLLGEGAKVLVQGVAQCSDRNRNTNGVVAFLRTVYGSPECLPKRGLDRGFGESPGHLWYGASTKPCARNRVTDSGAGIGAGKGGPSHCGGQLQTSLSPASLSICNRSLNGVTVGLARKLL